MLARAAALLSCVIACAAMSALKVAADEAYLCGPSTVVYVKTGDIEARKLSDPCIARHYGLKIQTAAAPMTDAAPLPHEVELPKIDAAGYALPSAAIAVRQAKITKSVKPNLAPTNRNAVAIAASVAAAVAAPGTDYRNVRVINAATSTEGWYRHMR